MSKLDGKTLDIEEQNILKLKELFPEIDTDGKIDFDKLKQVLGEYVEDSDERYKFTWNGKGEALRISQTPSMGTLRPAPEEGESKNWDSTKNLYIEGDNLEVLKLLQKSYFGKIKMIYIDPPYNTGKDFVYPDNYKDNIKNYKKITGQVDEEGKTTTTNPEYSGRYHTDWLNMMYPRLRLARNLLTDDGVIFTSIDDNEVHNLRKICDEVFGEDNFFGIITWAKKRKGSFLSKRIISLTEYLLVYAKNESSGTTLFGGKADDTESQPIIKRTNKISKLNIESGLITTKLEDGIYQKGIYGSDVNPVELLDNVIFKNGVNQNSFTIKAPFVWSQSFLNEQIQKGTRLIINTLNFQIRALRVYGEENFKGFPSYVDGVGIKGTNEDAYEELEDIFSVKKLFDYSKPVNYIKELINSSTYFEKNSIILDFFAGSSTTAHAVMDLNAEDNGNRKFIMVQLPEPTDEKSEAYKAGYKNIAEIGKERIRRAGEKIKEELQEKYEKAIEEERKNMKNPEDLDIGFKVFKLDSSNIKEWNPGKYDDIQLAIEDSANPYMAGRTEEDVVYEMILKMGIELTNPIEKYQVNGKLIYSIGYGLLMICLSDNIDLSIAKKMIEIKEENNLNEFRTIFRDQGFNSDTDKTNVKETLKSAGLAEESFITL